MLVLKNSTDSFARREAGGKGYNLYLLSRLGMPVPDWAVLGRSVYEEYVQSAGIADPVARAIELFSRDEKSAEETARRIREVILQADMPEVSRTSVEDAYRHIDNGCEVMISVRSSAADEDGMAHSFAGQLSSFLYVTGVDAAVKYVRECWASCFSDRALAYRKENGLPLQGLAVAVVIQRMIDPDVSGVLFTCDPVAVNPELYLASAVYGVGEGLVSGALEADTYWLKADSGAIERQEIVPKEQAFRRAESGECRAEEVDRERQNQPCLDAGQIKELHALGKSLDEFYRRPQDIEWAIAGKKLHVLQARAVTTIENNITGFPNLWDNSNIVESYGGPTLPLSFTFALHNYKGVYIQFCEILGVPASVVKDMEYYLGNMLGCINGRVFYNLYNWYKLVGVLPGFRQNRQFMETMMGVSEELSAEIADRIKPHPSWETPIGKLRRFRTGLAFIGYHFGIQRMVDRFLDDFRREYSDFRHRDYRRMSSDEIFQAYIEMDRRMLNHWKAPIINDFLCMVHFGLLKKLTNQWLGDLDTNIQNDLLSGGGEIESAEPTRVLITLAGQVAANGKLRELIESTPPEQLYEALNQSEFSDFFQSIADYIDRFGFRCMSEMKLEETDLFTDPKFLFICLKNYLRSGTTDLSTYEEREKTLRANAEKRVDELLSGLRKTVYRWSLKHARKAIKNRENTRFARTRVYGIARSMFQAMGEDLSGRGIIEAPRDVFYLTMDEVYGIHQGTLTSYDLKSVVTLRKRDYELFEDQEPKTRFLTRGPVYWQNSIIQEPAAPDIPPDADYDLKGLPCCPGIVEGVVKVVKSPQDDLELNGEILVAARTDPGWVPLYPSVSGLLVERGSLLSHSAIVAREMGLPAIVSISGLIHTLKSGQRVRMNGADGTIKILDEG